jgi:hypothetical protein
MNLLGAMNTDPRTQVAGQVVGFPALPLAREEAMLKPREEIALQIPAAVSAHPSPTGKDVERGIWTVKRGRGILSHQADL